jgi:hypothetical protein
MQALGWVHLLVTAAFTCWGVACLAVGVAQLGGCPRQPRLPLWLILQVNICLIQNRARALFYLANN